MPRDRKGEQILAEKATKSEAWVSAVRADESTNGARVTKIADSYAPGVANDSSTTSALDEASGEVGTGSPGVGHKRPVW
ncbi:hypothetical protein [Streptomyces sp. 5-10]|uniref:hypothetical protein n=1 Tax=Streptomyces sp. 5-10 TaxID=878925 RepID=UPI00168AED41|nr:hypothetical protein [Streptomyces sp. 5-10]MBD3004555.1 hypothetical protein [Streptomyces sp. 5-10]